MFSVAAGLVLYQTSILQGSGTLNVHSTTVNEGGRRKLLIALVSLVWLFLGVIEVNLSAMGAVGF